RVDTWADALEDISVGLPGKLHALGAAGANLEIVIARRAPDKPGTGVVFVTPVKGAKQTRAAQAAGFLKTENLHTVRIEGTDKPGLGARLAQACADQGLNLRGLSAAALGKKFVCHVAVDSEADAAKAARILRGL
ncbi:MAG: amino acid-binding protein, partial [Chloroflexi bacterium]|nr:amino acid-binding protein [Chloroflexota bacterium]